MNKIKKNDTVYVLAGRDRGKTGRVFMVMPKKSRALVEGVNYIKKHTRKTQAEQQGGIVQKESPIQLSNLTLFCKNCNKPARIGVSTLTDGSKSRYCKRCKEVI
ncbi:MAG: 50S ribosomal protein L24 [Candidatus Omnitrophica bacterium]|nr:50S ribosomal protein L24 [Candidatus Omnitrophota bacterium]